MVTGKLLKKLLTIFSTRSCVKRPISTGIFVNLLPRTLRMVRLEQLQISFGNDRSRFSSAANERSKRNKLVECFRSGNFVTDKTQQKDKTKVLRNQNGCNPFQLPVKNLSRRISPMVLGNLKRSLWLTISSSRLSISHIESGNSCNWFSSNFNAISDFIIPMENGNSSISLADKHSSWHRCQLPISVGRYCIKLLLASKCTNSFKFDTLQLNRRIRFPSTHNSCNAVKLPITSGNSVNSLLPISSRFKHCKRFMDFGSVIKLLSRNSSMRKLVSRPKFAGKYSRNVSFK